MSTFGKIILIFALIQANEASWKNVLEDVKQRARNKLRQKSSESTKNFLGHDLSEYPGTNKHFKNLNREKWNSYYECLSAQDKSLGHHQSVNPIAIVALEGNFVRLECRICLSPENMNDIHSVEWLMAKENDSALNPIEFDEHTLVTPDDKSLMLYNLRLDQNGQYICTLGQALTSPYFLTVIRNFESNINEVHSSEAKHGPYPENDFIMSGTNMKLSTQWGPWSSCSQCGKIGRKHRYGFCQLLYYQEESLQISLKEKSIHKKYIELLKIFTEGIPCSSHILPKEIRRNQDVKNRKDEVMIGYCQEQCKEDKVFIVRDEYGNVIEQANNSEGIYSVLQGMPPSEPHIEKTLEYATIENDITISCPGNLNSDAPLQWQIGDKTVVPEILAAQSNGRIYVGLTDRIHIKKVKMSDTNIYSCWQHKELAGIVRLIVEKKIKLNFNHHIMMILMIIIFLTFFWVFTKAFFGKKYARIKD